MNDYQIDTIDLMKGKKVIVITGCSSGIGLGVALELSRNANYQVIGSLRAPSKAPTSLSESDCDVQQLDVTDDASVSRLTNYLHERYGGCDVLINNAGFGVLGSLEAVGIEDARRVFEVNVWGVMRMCQQIVPQMRQRGGGLVVTISSTSGVCGQPHTDIYSASKQAVEGLLECYRYAVESDNVKVVIINPGPTVSQFSERIKAETGQPQHASDLKSFWIQRIAQRVAEGQPVEDCAREIVRVIERDIDKNIVGGKDSVQFWNPTSDFGRYVLSSVLKYPDGYSGIYAERFEAARKGEKSVYESN